MVHKSNLGVLQPTAYQSMPFKVNAKHVLSLPLSKGTPLPDKLPRAQELAYSTFGNTSLTHILDDSKKSCQSWESKEKREFRQQIQN